MALCTLARAIEYIPGYNPDDNTILQNILDASSDVIERWCGRVFALTAYDEVYDGQGAYNLLLNEFPITQIDRVMYNPIQVLGIRNADNSVSRATFRIDGTTAQPAAPNNLYLVSAKNAVQTTHTIALNTTPTFGDLATAINAFSADGWNAYALGLYSTWPVADLYPFQGAKDCRWQGNAYVRLHSWILSEIDFNPDVGEVVSPFYFCRGYRNYRVVYSAGYSTIPNPIEQACASLTASVYKARGINPGLVSESLGGWSYTAVVEKTFNELDLASKFGLNLYKSYRVNKFKVM